MKRRNFIKNSSLVAFSVSAFGAISWNGENFVGNSVTTSDILGPFYRPGAPMRSDIIPPNSKGTPMNLNGTVFKEDGRTPLSDALVEIWQCDENEQYDNSSDGYNFRGATMTGRSGKYNFKTIVPVPYKTSADGDSWRPAHIHMRISVPNQQDLITQIYFKGDKHIEGDLSASSPQSVSRILSIAKSSTGENEVTFDVIMSKEFPLENEVYNKITGLYKMDNGNNIEFIRKDDLLYMKRNGQLMEGLKYTGNNTFEGGLGYPKVSFELLAEGGTKAALVGRKNNTLSGLKFLKYSE